MIEIYNDFLSNDESSELIEYYTSNLDREIINTNNVYTFNGIDILNYDNLLISKKLDLNKATTRRVQLINKSIITTQKFHRHTINWTYLIFLNDDYVGGELVIDNFTVSPRKNQLIIFSGKLKHKVNQVSFGNRYTFVSFIDDKVNIKNNLI